MANLLVAPVVKYQIDAKKALAELDLILIRLRQSTTLKLEIGNSAVVQREGQKDISLYKLLDEGTDPHEIGDDNSILANADGSFGPIFGPVDHPGTPSHDISARVQTYVESLVQGQLTSLGNTTEQFVKLTDFQKLFENIGKDAVKFAQDITPNMWTRVKDGYNIFIKGKRVNLD